MTFLTKLTEAGAIKLAAAQAGGTMVELVEMAVGDGNGVAVAGPTGLETALVHEVWRESLSALTVSTVDNHIFIAEAIIPADEGGFTIREVGVYTDDGTLFAYGNFPTNYKPIVAEGAAGEMIIQTAIRVASTAHVTLNIDPSLVLATRMWCDGRFLQKSLNLSDVASAPIALANIGGEPAVTAGTVDQYYRGNKSWGSFVGSVRATLLAGVSFASSAAVTAADTVLDAFGKLQAQLTAHVGIGAAQHPAATISVNGFMSAADKLKLDTMADTPVGAIMPLSGTVASNWLRCDGTSYLQSAYAALSAKVGLLPRFVWTKRTGPGPGLNIGKLIFVNGNFVTLGYAVSTGGYFSSDNGVTWSTLSGNLAGNWADMCWTGTKYILVGFNNEISNRATLGGGAFTTRTSAFGSNNCSGIASNGAGTAVIVGSVSGLACAQRSTNNGDTWATVTLPSAGNWSTGNIIYAAGRYVFAACKDMLSYIYTSTDGSTWTLAANGLAGEMYTVAYVAGAFYAIGTHASGYLSVAKSTNGTTWTRVSNTAYPISEIGLIGDFSALPNGIIAISSANNFPTPLNYLHGDMRSIMQVTPPPVYIPIGGAKTAYGNGLLMALETATPSCFTAPLQDYNVATEFIVPDLLNPNGASAAPYYIRAS